MRRINYTCIEELTVEVPDEVADSDDLENLLADYDDDAELVAFTREVHAS